MDVGARRVRPIVDYRVRAGTWRPGQAANSEPGRDRDEAQALLAGARRTGLLVVVVDGHLLDEVSALLVTGGAATVVITIRSGERAPDAMAAVWKDALLERLEVQQRRTTASAVGGRENQVADYSCLPLPRLRHWCPGRQDGQHPRPARRRGRRTRSRTDVGAMTADGTTR